MAYTGTSNLDRKHEQLAGKMEHTQKKTFTKWVNSQLVMGGSKRRVADLFEDLKDGLILMDLMKIFTDEDLPRNSGMRMQRPQMIANVEQVLLCLERHVEELTGVTAPLIVDGDHSVTLGLIWRLIFHFQVAYTMDEGKKADSTQLELKTWAQGITEQYGIQVRNFTSSWSDGRAFCALVHSHWPELLNYKTEVHAETPQHNLELAFAAFKQKGIEGLLDPEDLACDEPDEKSIVIYVSSIRKHIVEKAQAQVAVVPCKEQTPLGTTVTVEVHPRKSPTPPSSDGQLMVTPTTIFVSTPKSTKKESPHEVVDFTVSPVAKPDSYQMSQVSHSKTTVTVVSTGMNVSDISETSFNIKGTSYVESWTSEMEKSDSAKDEVLLTWATKEVDSLRPFELAITLVEVKKQKQQCETLLSTMLQQSSVIVTQTESTISEPDTSGSHGPVDRKQVSVTISPAKYVKPLQATSLDEYKKRVQYLESSASPVKSPRRRKRPPRPKVPNITEDEKRDVKVSVKVRWDKLVSELEDWKRLLHACIAAWEKCISIEGKLRKLEEQHAKWGPPAENQDILEQLRDLQTFHTTCAAPFKCEVCAMTDLVDHLKSLGAHPPVEELCRCVTERYDWLISSLDVKCTATQECCRLAREFELVKQPFETWVTKAVLDIKGLLYQASDWKRFGDAKEALKAIQEVAMAKEDDVAALSELSTKFEGARKPIIREISEYHTKLQSLTTPSVTMAAMKEGTKNKGSTMPSIMVQTSNIEETWEWVLDQSIVEPKPPPTPEKVVLEGIPQGTLRVGQQYSLQADTSNAGDGQIKAVLSGPTKHEPCTVEEASNMKHCISFTPKETGKHKVHVVFAGTAVPLSPLEFIVVDPALVKVTPPSPNEWGVYISGEPHIFSITCPSGTEQVTATARGRQSMKESDIPVQDLGGGEYIATLITVTPDKYDIKFYYSGHLVPDSPYLLPVKEKANPDLVTCTIYVSPTDGEICVEADASRAGTGKLSATARGHKVGAVDCRTEIKDASKWVVTFNPPMPDVYTVHVYWNDMDVPHSPFTISTIQVDASKIRVEGPHSNQTPVLVVCETSDAGEGTLSAKCTGRRFGDVPVHVALTKKNQYKVSFTPPGKDHFSLSILWDGLHVPHSPFEININLPDASRVKVDGPHPCAEGFGPVHTFIDTSKAGNGRLQVKCMTSGEDGGPVDVTLPVEQPGHYTAVFEANKPGTYNVDITFNEEPVPGSPFRVTIKDDACKVYAWGPVVMPCELPREITKLNGHVVYRPTGKKLHLDIDSGAVPGTFKCTFKPTDPGLYKVHINNGSEPIQGSPIDVLVKPPLQPVVTGLHGAHCVDEAVPFQVDCTKVGVGNLVIRSELSPQKDQKIHHNEKTSMLDTMKREGCEGLYDGIFVPKVAGRHLVYIDWCGTPIDEAPFVIQAFHRDRPVTLPTIIELHKPVITEVFRNLHDTLSASAVGDHTGDAQVTIEHDEGNRRSVVRFTPLFPDTYTLSIFVNESHVGGSPIRIEVKGPRGDRDEDKNGNTGTTTSLHVPQAYLPCEVDGAQPKGFIHPDDICALSKPLELKPCAFRVNINGAGPGTLEVSSSGPSKCTLAIVDCKDDHSGICIVKCMPDRPGVYTFNVYWNGQPVQGSPLTVTFAIPIVITGLNLSTALFHVGKLYKFHARTDAIGAEDFKVAVNPASGAQIRIFEVWDLNYHVSVLPQEVGEHEISVTYGGQHIFGSPFQVFFQEQANASKCCLVEEDQPMEDGKVCFIVDTKEAGAGKLTAEVQKMQDQSDIPCEVEAVKGTNYRVRFKPQGSDAEYMVSIKYDGAHIPRSPFQLVLSSQPTASVCRAEGDGLRFAEVNKESHFVVYTDCTDADLTVSIDSEYEVVKPFTKNKYGGIYSVHYVPKYPGDHKIDILWDGQPIAGSPFTASVLQPLKAAKITVDRCSTGDVTFGSPVRFGIMAKDKILAQKLKVVAYLADRTITGEVIKHRGQSYTASFDPPEPGNYRVIVSCENQQVPGCPFTVRVCQPPLPNKVKAYGRGLREGATGYTCDFTVETKGAGAATLVVEVNGPKGPVKANIKKIPTDERAVLASFLPVHEGEYTIAVLWADTHISGSPFKVDVHVPNKSRYCLDESIVTF